MILDRRNKKTPEYDLSCLESSISISGAFWFVLDSAYFAFTQRSLMKLYTKSKSSFST